MDTKMIVRTFSPKGDLDIEMPEVAAVRLSRSGIGWWNDIARWAGGIIEFLPYGTVIQLPNGTKHQTCMEGDWILKRTDGVGRAFKGTHAVMISCYVGVEDDE